jgi:uroporphyrinogen decarboxylase
MRVFNRKVKANLDERYLGPHHIGFVSELVPGVVTPEEYFGCDVLQFTSLPTKNPIDYSGYFDSISEDGIINEWGILRIVDHSTGAERRLSPLQRADSVKEIEQYPLPDVDANYRWKGLMGPVDSAKKLGYATAGYLHGTFFELLCDLRGFEQLFMDLFTPIAPALFDLVTEIRIRQVLGLVKTGVDIIRIGDNIGMQTGMLLSPDMWRKHLKPGLRKLVDAIRAEREDIAILYKSDGDYEAVIGDLVDLGIDILCPIQAEVMDAQRIKRNFGSHTSLWGTVSTQSLLPYGTPEQIREKVLYNIRTLGADGGLIIGPDQMLLGDVPWENAKAFFDTVKEFQW